MAKYGANQGSVDTDGVFHPTGTYATQHPTGTGPYMLQSWTRGDKLVLVKNPNYWGTPGAHQHVDLPADRRQRSTAPGAAER